MKKRIYSLVSFYLFTFLFFQNISIKAQERNFRSGTIIINIKFSTLSEAGRGGKIKIRNMNTGQEYDGKSSNIFDSYIILPYLPFGYYEVIELAIRTGSGQISYRGKSNFNHIILQEEKVYYLGSYLVRKTDEIFKLNYDIFFDKKKVDIQKVKNQLKKLNEDDSNIEFSQKLFLSDTTHIKIKI